MSPIVGYTSGSTLHKNRSSSKPDVILIARELNLNNSPNYFRRKIYGSVDLTARLNLNQKLEGHNGCVNTVTWNKNGDLILSGSDDCRLNIWNPWLSSPLIASIPSGHQRNIFSAQFLVNSNDRKIVSCAMDGVTRFTDLDLYERRRDTDSWDPSPAFHCHSDLTYEVVPDPVDPHVFFDCSDDGKVNSYDLRIRTSCSCQHGCDRHTLLNINPEDAVVSLWESNLKEIRGMSIRSDNPVYFGIACSDDSIRVYDRRFISRTQRPPSHVYGFIPDHLREKHMNRTTTRSWRLSDANRITSLKFDPSGTGQILISYSRDKIYLVNPLLGPGDNMSTNKREQKDSTFMSSPRKKNKDCSEITPSEIRGNGEAIVGTPTSIMDISSGTGSDVEGKVNQQTFDLVKESDEILPVYSEVAEPGASISANHPQAAAREHIDGLLDLDGGESEDSVAEEGNDLGTVLGGQSDIVQSYAGHRNWETMIKEVNFYGPNSEFIVSGSDDGRIFIWDKSSGEIKHLLMGDSRVVNCVQPHPYDPILMSSGIDNDIKLWYPDASSKFDQAYMQNVVRQNQEISERDDEEEDSRMIVLPPGMILHMIAAFSERGGRDLFHFE